MKQKLLILFLLLQGSIPALLAQVQIQGTLPAVGLVQKNQLWNLVLVNGTTGDMNGVIELKLRDRTNGLEVLTAVTNTVTLKKGANTLNINNLSPVQYNYTGMQPDNSLNGLIPVGRYLACYSFVRFVSDYQETLAQECISFDIEALSPPMLIYPADSSRLDIVPSQFTWVPPAPANLFQALRYDYLLVEVMPGQVAAEAIQENIPVYNTGSLSNNVLGYSAASPVLEKNKWYAWQVIARDGEQYAGKSETWVFTITQIDSTVATKEKTIGFTLLSADPQRTGYVVLQEHQLYVKHYSYKSAYTGSIKVWAPSGELIQEQEQAVQYGDNYIRLSLKKGIEKGKTYTMSLTDDTGKQYKVLFSITDQNQQ